MRLCEGLIVFIISAIFCRHILIPKALLIIFMQCTTLHSVDIIRNSCLSFDMEVGYTIVRQKIETVMNKQLSCIKQISPLFNSDKFSRARTVTQDMALE